MILEGFLQGAGNADDLAVPENWQGFLSPLRARRKQNGVVPEKSIVDAAIGFQHRRILIRKPAELSRNEMLRVPELLGALVRDSGERAPNW